MRLIYMFMSILVISACDKGNSDSTVYSFDQIIEQRLADDERINGKEIWIESDLSSSFGLACPAVASEPCVALTENEDLGQYEAVDEYGHTKNTEYSCSTGSISLISNDRSEYERLEIDYNEHNEYYTITEVNPVRSTFRARVEFTEEVDYCAKRIYKGTRITLSDGEHNKVFELFVGGSN